MVMCLFGWLASWAGFWSQPQLYLFKVLPDRTIMTMRLRMEVCIEVSELWCTTTLLQEPRVKFLVWWCYVYSRRQPWSRSGLSELVPIVCHSSKKDGMIEPPLDNRLIQLDLRMKLWTWFEKTKTPIRQLSLVGEVFILSLPRTV